MDAPHARLGPFRVAGRLGQGGMGEVLAAVHDDGVEVAVKVLAGEKARTERARAAFRAEVAAAARLDHPGVVRLLDHGTVPEGASGLPAGSPYLVMERCQGTLADAALPLPWPALRDVLDQLLAALAHAHARGVVHRDLKPGNVLRRLEDDGGARLVLADFGLAHVADEPGGAASARAGTPRYMAPEQLAGDVRAFGPWTDLYALGCVAFELATGAPPFRDGSSEALAAAHLGRAPPALAGDGVPEGLAAVVSRLLAKDPRDRFRRAADVRHALSLVGTPGAAAVLPLAIRDRDADPTLAEPHRPVFQVDRGGRAPSPAEAPPPPPVPEDPGPLDPSAAPPRLFGAGLGLWGLRELGVVGRREERLALWGALREARSGLRVVLLHGPAGAGKSRLARWLCERAHELGAAEVLRAAHEPDEREGDALARLVAAHHRVAGLPAVEARPRLAAELRGADPAELDVLAALAARAAGAGGQLRAEERHAAVVSTIARAASARPALVVLDDVHHGPDSLALVRRLLGDPDRAGPPALLVLTVRDEALAERPGVAAALDELRADRRVRDLPVALLPRDDRALLVRRLLHLSGPAAGEVEERTAGNPLFAVQLVDDWVQRGVLVADRGGFRLREGESPEPPAALHEVWRRRVERLLAARPAADALALERAAALGLEVDLGEWAEACEGEPPSADLLHAVQAARLGTLGPGTFAFVHGMLREALERAARDGGRWAPHHERCARMLARRRGPAERLGRHLLEAGRGEEAIAPLLEAVDELADVAAYGPAEALLARVSAPLAALPEHDPRRGLAELYRLRMLRKLGRREERAAGLAALLDRGDRFAWPAIRVGARRELAAEARIRGALDEGLALVRDGIAALRPGEEPRERARCLVEWSGLALYAGDAAGAERRAREALPLFEEVGNASGIAVAQRNVAIALRMRGALAEAEVLLEELARRPIGRHLVSDVLNELAEVQALQGKLEAAEATHLRGLGLSEELGAETDVVHMNLAFVRLLGGRWADARRGFERTVRLMGANALYESYLRCGFMVCDAAEGRLDAVAAALAGEEAEPERAANTWEQPWSLTRVGALVRGERPGLAARAYRRAALRWHRLGEAEKARAADEAARALDVSGR